MKQVDPLLTPDQIKDVLTNSGIPLTDPKNGLTFPRVDAFSALFVEMGNDPTPALIRLRNVTPTGFEIRIQQWDDPNAAVLDHGTEIVNYVVVEKGHYSLRSKGGVSFELEAGTQHITAAYDCGTLFPGWQRVTFLDPFEGVTPQVFTTLQTLNGPEDAVVTRVKEITSFRFDVIMQEKRDADQVHPVGETVGYLAWTPTQSLSDPNQAYVLHGRRFEVGKTLSVVDENFYFLGFSSSFVDPPLLVMDMQTANGCDPSNLRWRNKSGDGVEVAVTEDIPEDHLEAESVGYVALSCEDCDPGIPPPGGGGTEAVFRVTQEGTVYSDRAYYCGLSSNCFNVGAGADLAERIDVTEPVEPGDVIEIDPQHPGRYRKARERYSPRVVGVVATAPGITLANRPEELQALGKAIAAHREMRDLGVRPLLPALAGKEGGKAKAKAKEFALTGVGAGIGVEGILTGSRVPRGRELLARLLHVQEQERLRERLGVGVRLPGRPLLALMGRVYVKATAENGPIRPGDLLVSASLPGYAMRCPEPSRCEGAILGKALEPLEEGTGRILMLLMK